MFIVPLPGDKVQTQGGVTHTVLSYSNYKDQPAVYVEAEGNTSKAIPFGDIVSVNGTDVKLTPGKVLESTGRLKRKVQLPQRDDKVKLGSRTIKLDTLKLTERGKLSNGMLVVGTDIDTKEKVTDRLANVTGILRADGEQEFNRRALRTTYSDYMGSAS